MRVLGYCVGAVTGRCLMKRSWTVTSLNYKCPAPIARSGETFVSENGGVRRVRGLRAWSGGRRVDLFDGSLCERVEFTEGWLSRRRGVSSSRVVGRRGVGGRRGVTNSTSNGNGASNGSGVGARGVPSGNSHGRGIAAK